MSLTLDRSEITLRVICVTTAASSPEPRHCTHAAVHAESLTVDVPGTPTMGPTCHRKCRETRSHTTIIVCTHRKKLNPGVTSTFTHTPSPPSSTPSPPTHTHTITIHTVISHTCPRERTSTPPQQRRQTASPARPRAQPIGSPDINAIKDGVCIAFIQGDVCAWGCEGGRGFVDAICARPLSNNR